MTVHIIFEKLCRKDIHVAKRQQRVGMVSSGGNQDRLKEDAIKGSRGCGSIPPLALEQEAKSTLTTCPFCCCHPICR